MKVLLLGSSGMLGQAVKRQMDSRGIKYSCVDRNSADYMFDLLNDVRLETCIREVKPDVVINTVAVISLEQCDGDPGGAYCLNTRLPSVLASLCDRYGCYLVHISTDHYYCGEGRKLHTETDSVRLMNEYARTKYIGENMALMHDDTLVLRTNIVGFRGRGRLTFLEWAISEIKNHRKMMLFIDFYTSSIHTVDFARIMFDALEHHPVGIYNLASSEVSNKKEFILNLSEVLFSAVPEYEEGSVENLNGAKRGNSLGLDIGKMEKLVGYRMPGLMDTIQSINAEYRERVKRNEI